MVSHIKLDVCSLLTLIHERHANIVDIVKEGYRSNIQYTVAMIHPCKKKTKTFIHAFFPKCVRGVARWTRKPVNHTNRMDVVCCHLIDRPQSVPQLPCNRTLQFSKTFSLNSNAIFSLSSNTVLLLETPLNVLNVISTQYLMSL